MITISCQNPVLRSKGLAETIPWSECGRLVVIL